MVSPVPRTGPDLRPALPRSPRRLQAPARRSSAEPRQLPASGGALRAGPAALFGHRHARLGGTPLRAHPDAERDETPTADLHAAVGQSRRRSQGHGRSRSLRSAAPCGAGRPLCDSEQGLAGHGGVRPRHADRLDRRRHADVAGRLLQRPPRLPVGTQRHPATLRLGPDAARRQDQTLRAAHLRHAVLPRILHPAQRAGLDAGRALSAGPARGGTLRQAPDRLRRTGTGAGALQTPPRRPAARRKLLPVGDRHRELSPASRLGGPLHQPGAGAFPRRDRLPALERPCAELHQAVRQSDKSLSTIAPLCAHRFAARRDLGNDRRHLAPESRGGGVRRRRGFRADQPQRLVPCGHEAVLQSL